MVKLCVLFGVAVLLSVSFGFINGAPQVPCYFIFGDSLVDNGNNNRLSSLARANYLPYGIDFPNGPTGRFSNGKTTVDVIGELSICSTKLLVLMFISMLMPGFHVFEISYSGRAIFDFNLFGWVGRVHQF